MENSEDLVPVVLRGLAGHYKGVWIARRLVDGQCSEKSFGDRKACAERGRTVNRQMHTSGVGNLQIHNGANRPIRYNAWIIDPVWIAQWNDAVSKASRKGMKFYVMNWGEPTLGPPGDDSVHCMNPRSCIVGDTKRDP